jgi:hypothetical protein
MAPDLARRRLFYRLKTLDAWIEATPQTSGHSGMHAGSAATDSAEKTAAEFILDGRDRNFILDSGYW